MDDYETDDCWELERELENDELRIRRLDRIDKERRDFSDATFDYGLLACSCGCREVYLDEHCNSFTYNQYQYRFGDVSIIYDWGFEIKEHMYSKKTK